MCLHCAAELPTRKSRGGPKRLYCSNRCCQKRRGPPEPPITCVTCGVMFPRPSVNGKKPKYCSRQCWPGNQSQISQVCLRCNQPFCSTFKKKYCCKECLYPPTQDLRCPTCKNYFSPNSKQQKYCSNACGTASPTKHRYRPCLCCTKLFRKNNHCRNAGKYCSRECAFEARRLRLPCAARPGQRQRPPTLDTLLAVWFFSWGQDDERKPARRVPGTNYKSRCRRFGCHYEPFSRVAIFKRDGWVCQLCGIHLRERWPHPHSASLDHIVPLSAGPGSPGHRPSNAQAACLQCNTAKADSFAPLYSTVRQ